MGLRAGRLARTEGGFPGRVHRTHCNPVSEDLDSADLIRSLRPDVALRRHHSQ